MVVAKSRYRACSRDKPKVGLSLYSCRVPAGSRTPFDSALGHTVTPISSTSE
jgi:hypothetical protein